MKLNVHESFFNILELLYHAPELLRHSKGCPTHKSDVYSLGIVLEEIIVRGGPYEEASPDYTPEGMNRSVSGTSINCILANNIFAPI